MKIIKLKIPDSSIIMTIQEFAKLHDLNLITYYRGFSKLFYACFENSYYGLGEGETEEEAIIDYAQQISGKVILIAGELDNDIIIVGKLI